MTEPIPLPGSDEAKRNKCTCDAQVNRRIGGSGAYVDRKGKTRFVITRGCPLHATEKTT
jgi:hypothetical protein